MPWAGCHDGTRCTLFFWYGIEVQLVECQRCWWPAKIRGEWVSCPYWTKSMCSMFFWNKCYIASKFEDKIMISMLLVSVSISGRWEEVFLKEVILDMSEDRTRPIQREPTTGSKGWIDVDTKRGKISCDTPGCTTWNLCRRKDQKSGEVDVFIQIFRWCPLCPLFWLEWRGCQNLLGGGVFVVLLFGQ